MPDWLDDHQRAEAARADAAKVDGRHYAAFVPEVEALLKSGDDDAAAGLLLRLVDAVEREAKIPLAGHGGVPRWYFDKLAAIYRRRGAKAERGLLVQRHTRLQVEAETQGQLALIKQRNAAAKTPGPRRVPVAPGPAETAGRVAGNLVGVLLRFFRQK